MSDLIPITTRKVVDVTDPEYFCNKSWTLSFNMNTKSWTSFHSYIPNFYIGENNFFYSGLNGGCDLEAIAATEVAYTTTSTTTLYCPGCQPPATTTSTTTKTVDCRLAGSAVATPTTTTTTTLCPGCNTYTITNSTEEIQNIVITDCLTNSVKTIPIYLITNNFCSCTEPVVPEGVTSVLYGSGCTSCFCYIVTSSYPSTIQYTNCSGEVIYLTLGENETVKLCIKDNQIQGSGIDVYGGTVDCTANGDCASITTTSTTTSTSSTTTTTTTEFPVPLCSQNLVAGRTSVDELYVWDLCVDYNKNVTTLDYYTAASIIYSMTSNSTKVWTSDVGSNNLYEFDITFNPFSGLTLNQGWSLSPIKSYGDVRRICAKGNTITNTLIVCLESSTVGELDLSNPTISFTPTMPTSFSIFGFSMIYVPGSNKLIVLTDNGVSGSYLTQCDYTTGAVEINIDLSAYLSGGDLVLCSLFSSTCDGVCAIYIYNSYDDKVWKVDVTTQEITDSGKTIDFTGYPIIVSQLPSCTCIINTTTTTTTTSCPNCVDHDVTIGSQVWMGCNLNVDRYLDGTLIPEISDPAAWAAAIASGTGAWCYYNNDPANGPIYGKIYNWYAVNDTAHGGLAPLGYHIPSKTEWETLITNLGGDGVAGDPLKEEGICHWTDGNTGTNTSGFTALPGGYVINNYPQLFLDQYSRGVWWSSTPYAPDPTRVWSIQLYYSNSLVFQVNDLKTEYSYSVRCIKD